MPTRRHLSSLLLATLIISSVIGCQNSPGQIFSPTSDLHVTGVSPSFLQPTEDTSGGAVKITLPQVNVFFRIANGVSAFLDGYQVRYVTTNGLSLSSGRFDHAGALSVFLQASSLGGTGTGSGTGSLGSTGGTGSIRAQASPGTGTGSGAGGTQTITSQATGYVSMELLTAGVFQFMYNGTLTYTDDLSPVIAQISFHGRDLNDHELNLSFNITLSTMRLSSEGSSSGS